MDSTFVEISLSNDNKYIPNKNKRTSIIISILYVLFFVAEEIIFIYWMLDHPDTNTSSMIFLIINHILLIFDCLHLLLFINNLHTIFITINYKTFLVVIGFYKIIAMQVYYSIHVFDNGLMIHDVTFLRYISYIIFTYY